MKKLSLLILTLFVAGFANAQMTVDNTAPYNSAAYLVNNILMGSGVTASNITFSGQAAQIGFFYDGLNGTPNLGIDSGIVISSGDVNDIPAGGNQPDQGQYAGPGDPDLLTIAQSVTSNPQASSITSTNDGAFLEFDFTPIGDTVKFDFVFASEEYTTYINSVFNDIFAFFVSGPGITGPYASPGAFPNGAINVAQVPGTTDPITISTIYNDPSQTPPSVNGQFYISNTTEQCHDFNGFTTVMTIQFPVQCGQLYHFKIAVADCEDDYLDTGVFLKASSFSSTAVEVNVVTATGDSSIIEGCAGATLNFTRPDTTGAYTVHFDIGGNAINGTDYVHIDDSVTFQAGSDTTSLTITAITDGLAEGTDTITITVYTINPCGDTIISTGVIYILDLPNMITDAPDTSLACPQSTLNISVDASGAVPPFSYQWTDANGNPIGGNTSSIVVQALETDTFYVSVTDSCNLITITDTVIITLNIPPLVLTAPNDTIICPGDSVTLTAFGSGGSPGYNYTWTPGGNSQTITVAPTETTSFIIAMTDQCNTVTMFDTVEVNNDYTTLSLTIPNVASVCLGEPMDISATASNGRLPYNFNWTDGIDNYSGNTFAYPTTTPGISTLVLTVDDGCDSVAQATIDVEIIACEVIIPNVFTPNGDGSNDFLVFENLEYYPNNQLVIFNRWGQKLLETNGYKNDWDGEDYSDGTYFFILNLGNSAGTQYKGTFNLFR